MAAGGSRTAVLAAIGANSVVAVAKFAGFFWTGSGAMLAEAIHSVADVGNQALLAVGLRSAQKPADATHPEGYEREAFVWALISAVGIFFVGCGVSVTHGVHSLMSDHGHDAGAGPIALGVLALSLVVEGWSLMVAVNIVRKQAAAAGQGFLKHLKTTEDPFAVAIILEDFAAVFGVILAIIAVALSHFTHNPMWDSVGTIVIGMLLGLVAVFLIRKNSGLLIGRAMGERAQAQLDQVLASDPAVEEVISGVGVVRGASSVRVRAQLEIDGGYMANKYLEQHDVSELRKGIDSDEAFKRFLASYSDDVMDLVGDEIDRIEDRIREAVPSAKQIDIEID